LRIGKQIKDTDMYNSLPLANITSGFSMLRLEVC